MLMKKTKLNLLESVLEQTSLGTHELEIQADNIVIKYPLNVVSNEFRFHIIGIILIDFIKNFNSIIDFNSKKNYILKYLNFKSFSIPFLNNNNIIIILARTPEIGQGLGRILSCGARKPEQT